MVAGTATLILNIDIMLSGAHILSTHFECYGGRQGITMLCLAKETHIYAKETQGNIDIKH